MLDLNAATANAMIKTQIMSETGALAGALSMSAWHTWRRLARSEAMSTPDGRDVMLKRHEIVVRIIDVNSRILRIDNEINGLDIERRNGERDVDVAPSSGRREALLLIEERISDLGAVRQKILTEKTWLEQTLDDFDSAAAGEMNEKHGARWIS